MVVRRKLIFVVVGLALSCLLAACTGVGARTTSGDAQGEDAAKEAKEEADKKKKLKDITLTVATTDGPYALILNEFATPLLAEQRVKLKVNEFGSAEEANAACKDGKADASFCQRQDEFNAYDAEQQSGLVTVGPVFYRPIGVFSHRHDKLRDIPDDATIAVSNHAEERGRALMLLQQEGVLTLNDPKKLDAGIYDLAENPRFLHLREVDPVELIRLLDEVDYVVIGPDTPDETDNKSETEPKTDAENEEGAKKPDITSAIAIEASNSYAAMQYASIVTTKQGNAEDEGIMALMETLRSPEFALFLQDEFGQEIVAIG